MTIHTELLDIVRKDRARRTRRQKLRTFFEKLFQGALTSAVFSLMNGWMLMLAVGVVHAHWWPAVPTIGYWWAVLIVWLLNGVFSARQTKAKDSDR